MTSVYRDLLSCKNQNLCPLIHKAPKTDGRRSKLIKMLKHTSESPSIITVHLRHLSFTAVRSDLQALFALDLVSQAAEQLPFFKLSL